MLQKFKDVLTKLVSCVFNVGLYGIFGIHDDLPVV